MNKEQLEEMYTDITKIGSLILDMRLFNHSDSMKDSFNIIYKSNSELFRTINEAVIREELAKHNIKCKADRGSCEIPGGFVSQGAGLAVRDASQAGSCHSETIRSS